MSQWDFRIPCSALQGWTAKFCWDHGGTQSTRSLLELLVLRLPMQAPCSHPANLCCCCACSRTASEEHGPCFLLRTSRSFVVQLVLCLWGTSWNFWFWVYYILLQIWGKKRRGGGRIIHLQIFLLYKCGLVEVIMMLTGADPAVCLSGGTKVFRLWIVDFKVLQPKGVSCLCKCFWCCINAVFEVYRQLALSHAFI